MSAAPTPSFAAPTPVRPARAPRTVRLRLARPEDAAALEGLQARAARELAAAWYTPAQLGAFVAGIGTLDPQLLVDDTYYVAEVEGRLAGCGGWSFRAGTHGASRADGPTRVPGCDPACMRGYFVDPDFARRGIASAILMRAECAARARGFEDAELLATLAGEPVYRRHGYAAVERTAIRAGTLELEAVRMTKRLVPTAPRPGAARRGSA
jgi:GNAT superfamily N-acetyltransferase